MSHFHLWLFGLCGIVLLSASSAASETRRPSSRLSHAELSELLEHSKEELRKTKAAEKRDLKREKELQLTIELTEEKMAEFQTTDGLEETATTEDLTNLLARFDMFEPSDLNSSSVWVYIEPFVGFGSLHRGDNFTFTCRAVGDPNATIHWQHESGGLPENAKVDEQGRLTILAAQPANEGKYLCLADTREGPKSETTFVMLELDYGWTSNPAPSSNTTETADSDATEDWYNMEYTFDSTTGGDDATSSSTTPDEVVHDSDPTKPIPVVNDDIISRTKIETEPRESGAKMAAEAASLITLLSIFTTYVLSTLYAHC